MGAVAAFRPFEPSAHDLSFAGRRALQLEGRKRELKQLQAAWRSAETGCINVVAPAGMGKTALWQTCLEQLHAQDWPGIAAVYVWQFQRDKEGQWDIAPFMHQLSAWLNVQVDAASDVTALSAHIRRSSLLLILDNIPAQLQQQPGGKQLLQLLQTVATGKKGLCLATSREALATPPIKQLTLQPLSAEAGAQLLQQFGLQDSERTNLTQIACYFDYHPLTLVLLGGYLARVCERDISRIDSIPIWQDAEVEGRHVRRILSAFSHWLRRTPELALLYVLSLLPEAMSENDLLALLQQIPSKRFSLRPSANIPEVLRPLQGVKAKRLQQLHNNLKECHLLYTDVADHQLDLHPAVREYFYQELQSRFAVSWQAAQRLVHDYLGIRAERPTDTPKALPIWQANPPAPATVAEFAQQNKFQAEPVFDAVIKPAPASQRTAAKPALKSFKALEAVLERAVAAKNWVRATQYAQDLHDGYKQAGDEAKAALYARQCAAFAQLSGDKNLLKSSLDRLNTRQTLA